MCVSPKPDRGGMANRAQWKVGPAAEEWPGTLPPPFGPQWLLDVLRSLQRTWITSPPGTSVRRCRRVMPSLLKSLQLADRGWAKRSRYSLMCLTPNASLWAVWLCVSESFCSRPRETVCAAKHCQPPQTPASLFRPDWANGLETSPRSVLQLRRLLRSRARPSTLSGAPNNQLDLEGQRSFSRISFLQRVEQQLGRARRHLANGLTHDRDRRLQRVGQIEVVEAHQRDRLRNRDIGRVQNLVRVHGDAVLDTKDRVNLVRAVDQWPPGGFRGRVILHVQRSQIRQTGSVNDVAMSTHTPLAGKQLSVTG